MSTVPKLVELRQGNTGDLLAVSAVMGDAFDPRYGEAWTSAQCLGMLSLSGVWLTVAEHRGAITGFALSRVIAGDGELLLLAVRPAKRGSGIGAALLRATIADAQTRGAERLHLEVRAGNSAVNLYRAHGFSKVGERRAYYRGIGGQSYDAQTYSRNLQVSRIG